MSEWLLLAIIALPAFFAVVLYNRIVALRQSRLQAFSDIDVQLKLRHDLIPNLVETVKGYATHEKETFERITNLRASAMKASSPQEKIGAEAGLSSALMNLMAIAENYPDLKANQNFQSLQNELSDVENKISAARRFFNNATSEYNTQITQFPAVLIANMFKFTPETFFEVEEGQKAILEQPVAVKF